MQRAAPSAQSSKTLSFCYLQLRFALFLDVLTPLQAALIYAKTYPASVDVVTMAKCGTDGFNPCSTVGMAHRDQAIHVDEYARHVWPCDRCAESQLWKREHRRLALWQIGQHGTVHCS